MRLRSASADYPEARRRTPEPGATPTPAHGSSLRAAALQHVPAEEPFLPPGNRRASGRPCHAFQKPRPRGLATPSAALALPLSEAYFSFPRSWASPFRAFLRPHGTPMVSHGRPVRTLQRQTHGLGGGAPTAHAREASRASSARARILARVEPLLSWASAPPGLASAGSQGKRLPSPCPSRSFLPGLRRCPAPEPQGVPSDGPAFPPFQGALARVVFSTGCICHFLGT